MSADPVAWLQAITSETGVLGCGLRWPGDRSQSQSFSAQFPSAKLDEMWAQQAEAFQALQWRGFTLHCLRWKFHLYHVWYLARPDGLALGLVLRLEGPEKRARLEELSREFLEGDWAHPA